MSGGAHDPLPPFEAFPPDFFATGWDMAPCDVSTGLASLRVSCCLQTLRESGLSVKERTRESRIPIDSLYDVSDFPLEKALIDFAITNKVLQKLDQPDKTELTPCDHGMDVGDVVQDEGV